MGHERVTERTEEREVYEPPMLVEIGQFTELTSGGGAAVADGVTGGFEGALHQ